MLRPVLCSLQALKMGLRSSGSTGSVLPRAISPGAFGSFVGVGMCMCLGTLTGVGSDFHLAGAGPLLFLLPRTPGKLA